jgi:hypothetical protein
MRQLTKTPIRRTIRRQQLREIVPLAALPVSIGQLAFPTPAKSHSKRQQLFRARLRRYRSLLSNTKKQNRSRPGTQSLPVYTRLYSY